MGLLWMKAGLSCFLSSGDGYVGKLLELQQGCEGPFSKFQILDVISLEKPQRKWASSRLTSGTSKGSFTALLQLKNFPTYPSLLKRKHESPAHIQKSPVSAS